MPETQTGVSFSDLQETFARERAWITTLRERIGENADTSRTSIRVVQACSKKWLEILDTGDQAEIEGFLHKLQALELYPDWIRRTGLVSMLATVFALHALKMPIRFPDVVEDRNEKVDLIGGRFAFQIKYSHTPVPRVVWKIGPTQASRKRLVEELNASISPQIDVGTTSKLNTFAQKHGLTPAVFVVSFHDFHEVNALPKPGFIEKLRSDLDLTS